MALTLDVWDIPPESAVRVQHPAPFPVELPQRLMELYTYRGDLVVDPFCGSGSTLVAARRSGRDAVGYDLDPAYVDIARARLAGDEAAPVGRTAVAADGVGGVGGLSGSADGTAAMTLAREAIEAAGFRDVRANRRLRGLGLAVSFSAVGAGGRTWYFDVAGANSSYRGGMAKSETVWRTLGRANVMAAGDVGPLVVLTTQLPRAGTEPDRALRAPGPGGIFDVVDLGSPGAAAAGAARLAAYAKSRGGVPLPGFWRGVTWRRGRSKRVAVGRGGGSVSW